MKNSQSFKFWYALAVATDIIDISLLQRTSNGTQLCKMVHNLTLTYTV